LINLLLLQLDIIKLPSRVIDKMLATGLFIIISSLNFHFHRKIKNFLIGYCNDKHLNLWRSNDNIQQDCLFFALNQRCVLGPDILVFQVKIQGKGLSFTWTWSLFFFFNKYFYLSLSLFLFKKFPEISQVFFK
jgi:hypothetical protein